MRSFALMFALVWSLLPAASAQTITGKYLFVPRPEPGAWYTPGQGGTGWFFDFQGDVAFGASFGYEPQGDSRFWTVAGVMTPPPDPTGPTNQPGLPIATMIGATFASANGQCHGCPYQAPMNTQVHAAAQLTWQGPRKFEFTADGTTVSMVPFDTAPFDLSGDWQGTYHFRNGPEHTSRPVFRLTRRTDMRIYHVDPAYPAGHIATLPAPGAQEYQVQCIADCANTFAPLLPTVESMWWIDPSTGLGGVVDVRNVNPGLFPTPHQVYQGSTSYGRWSPQVWASRNRIVARSYVPFLQAQTADYVREIELVRLVPGQYAGLRL
jgi:hypothetical protein